MNATRVGIGAFLLAIGTSIYLALAGAPGPVRVVTIASQWLLLGTSTAIWSFQSKTIVRISLSLFTVLIVAPLASAGIGRYVGPLAFFDPVLALRLTLAYAVEVAIYVIGLLLISRVIERLRRKRDRAS